MSLSDARILRQNPWWTSPRWEEQDAHLRRLATHPVLLPNPLPDRLDIDRPGLHTLRGPRQVGKSTSLKSLVQKAISAGRPPRNVVYLALDLLQDRPLSELADTVERTLVLAGTTPSRLLLLDEVTAVAGWQTAVKSLWDDGTIDRDVVICTGSSALDLADGTAERLPGRRGAGKDHLVLPQTFASFARALDPEIPGSPAANLEALAAPAGREILEEARLFGPRLEGLLDRFLVFGGLPASVREAVGGSAEPSEETRRLVRDSLDRELRRKSASLPALYALLERTVRSLGSKVSWSRLATEMAVPLKAPEHQTVRDYVELLAAAYFLIVVYYWRPDSDANALSKDKKLYFGDPLLYAVARDQAPGLAEDRPARVEDAFAAALLRRYEPEEERFEGFLSPRRLHVWGTSRGGEIDFVCGPRERVDVLEVKLRRRIDRRTVAAIPRAFPGRPVFVATKNEFDLSGDYLMVPAHLLLWALG